MSNIHPSHSRGRWILLERGMKLLSIGQKMFAGVSPRRGLDRFALEILIPEVEKTLTDTKPRETSHTEGQEPFVLRTHPIVAPKTGKIVAVQAIYYKAGEEILPMPYVGCYEWEIRSNGADTSMHINWDENLHTIYEIPLGHRFRNGVTWAEAPEWLDKTINVEDRQALRGIIDAALEDTSENLYILGYGIIAGYHTPNPTEKRLRLAARFYPNEKNNGGYIRGITQEIGPNPDPSRVPIDAVNTNDVIRAAFELSSDRPMMALDTKYWQIYMTSPQWEQNNLGLVSRYFRDFIKPDDLQRVQEYIVEATTHGTLASE